VRVSPEWHEDWVTNGSVAGLFHCFLRRPIWKRAEGHHCVPGQQSSKGFRVGGTRKKWGSSLRRSVEIVLNDCEVPAVNRLGRRPGAEDCAARRSMAGSRIGIGAPRWGWRKGALEGIREVREAAPRFGKPSRVSGPFNGCCADMQTGNRGGGASAIFSPWPVLPQGDSRPALRNSFSLRFQTEAKRAAPIFSLVPPHAKNP